MAQARDHVDIVADSGDRFEAVGAQRARVMLVNIRTFLAVHDVNRDAVAQGFEVCFESKMRVPVGNIETERILEDVRGGKSAGAASGSTLWLSHDFSDHGKMGNESPFIKVFAQ
jgi:hypothetical protein